MDATLHAVSEWYANEKPSGPYQPPAVEELEPDIAFAEDTGTFKAALFLLSKLAHSAHTPSATSASIHIPCRGTLYR